MSKAPPVPPAGRTNKGAGGKPSSNQGRDQSNAPHHPEKRNLAEQGHHGNVRQNTHHQGYQQDR